jgi:hypothetical protein
LRARGFVRYQGGVDEVKVSYAYGRAEVLAAGDQYVKARPSVKIRAHLPYYGGIALFTVGLFVCSMFGSVGLYFLVLALVWPTAALIQYYLSNREALKSQIIDMEVTWTFNEDTLQMAWPGTSSRFDYGYVEYTGISPRGIFLMFNRTTVYWLPRKAFTSPEDFERLAQLLARRTQNVVHTD